MPPVVIAGETIGFFYQSPTSGRFKIPEQRGKGYGTKEEVILALMGNKLDIVESVEA